MKKYLDIVKKCPLFEGISDSELERVLTCFGARVERFDKKHTIFQEGNTARYIGILLDGGGQVIQLDYYGNRSIVSEIKPTEIFAEEFACAEVRKIPVSVVANEDSEVMLIEGDHILHTCSNNCGFHQRLIFNLMKQLAQKNIEFHQRIEITSKRSTREKLLAYLWLQATRTGSNSFDIPFDRQELADYLEVERSGLSAEISKMKKEGIIENQKNHFVLL